METLQKQEENSYNDQLFYPDKNWKVATAYKKRKTRHKRYDNFRYSDYKTFNSEILSAH